MNSMARLARGVLVFATLAAVAFAIYLPSVGFNLPVDWLAPIENWQGYFRLAVLVFGSLAALALLAFLTLIFLRILIHIFVPVAPVLGDPRDPIKWLRTVVLSGVFIFLIVYLQTSYLGRWLDPIDRLKADLKLQLESRNAAWALLIADLLLAITVALLAYVIAVGAYASVVGLGEFVGAFNRWTRRTAEKTEAFIKVFWTRSNPAVKSVDNSGHLQTAYWGCFLIDASCLGFGLAQKDWIAVSVASAAAVVVGMTLYQLLSEGMSAPEQNTIVEVLPSIALSLLSCAIVLPYLKLGDFVGFLPPNTMIGAVRSALYDLAFAIVITLLICWFLTRGWRSDPRSDLEAPPGTDNAATRKRYVSEIIRGLWQTTGLFFALKLAIVCIGAVLSGTLFTSAPTIPDSITRKLPSEVAATKLDVEMKWQDFIYMGWSGNLLQSDEFLFERLQPKENKIVAEDFKPFSEKFRNYYEPRFIYLVVVQSVFGWNYGMSLLCYLLFAFALYVFRFPAPPLSSAPRTISQLDFREASAEAYANQRRDTGAIDRIREASDAITTLGFIGTLLGLSQAIFFLGTSDALSEYLKRSAISSQLAGSLGLAFFTTFVAMVLRLILNLRFAQLAGERLAYQKVLRLLR